MVLDVEMEKWRNEKQCAAKPKASTEYTQFDSNYMTKSPIGNLSLMTLNLTITLTQETNKTPSSSSSPNPSDQSAVSMGDEL